MKKKFLTLGVFMMVMTYGFSQVEIKVNPIAALFGVIPLSAEYVITDNIGVEATLGYYFKKDNNFTDASKTSGLVINGLFKYYFKPDDGGDKFYAFPYIRYAKRSATFTDNTTDITATYTAFGAGFGLGYKWVAASGILVDIGFGLGKNFSGGYTYDDPNYSNIDASLIPINGLARISLGYRF